ncbi:hypothetical protein SAMN05216203_1504 [Marinobacter daqiaonensis]|uniref:Uncharacterized protein n=1 Tax=Marinobacter daqiaonensis TaxID=650891 RepID=A0A1I6HSQ8_9GAMM|nr:hypothetical protein [Marinobacter daqiaonensis]SFR57475.1 hypothetical protein SAMN05216203_1504 [Marinobacter daqiaonensis]
MDEHKGADHVIRGFNPSTIFANGFSLGSADLIQGGSLRVVGRTVSALLQHVVDEEGGRAFTGATIILPPISATKDTEVSVFNALIQATEELRGYELDELERPILPRLVRILHSPSLNIDDLLATAQKQGKRRLVAIASASQYRDPKLELIPTFGISSVRMNEDRWTPHVTSLCRLLVPIVEELDGYGLVHVMEAPAKRPSNSEQLVSVDNCYVTALFSETDLEGEFNFQTQKLKTMILQDRLLEVITELDDLGLAKGAQLHALAQLLAGTGRDRETLKIIEELLL